MWIFPASYRPARQRANVTSDGTMDAVLGASPARIHESSQETAKVGYEL